MVCVLEIKPLLVTLIGTGVERDYNLQLIFLSKRENWSTMLSGAYGLGLSAKTWWNSSQLFVRVPAESDCVDCARPVVAFWKSY